MQYEKTYGMEDGKPMSSKNFRLITNMKGTMSKHGAWTSFTHSKQHDDKFQELF
jgi:hypothetical protein